MHAPAQRRGVFVLATAIHFFALAAHADLTILYSASANGILRSCHCPNAPWGGLAKRVWLVDQLRALQGATNVVVLDAGDLFPLEEDADRLPALLNACNGLALDAIAVGEQDLALWTNVPPRATWKPWSRHANEPRLPWLSSATPLADADGLAVPPWRIVQRAGLRIGIVGLLGTEAFRWHPERQVRLTLPDPLAVLRAFRTAHSNDVDLVIALSHLGLEADRELAAKAEGLDLIIGGHTQALLDPVEIVGGVIVAQPGKNGENLGLLSLAPAPGNATRWRIRQRIVPLDEAIDEDARAAEAVDRYYAGLDARNRDRLSHPDAATNPAPRLRIREPNPRMALAPGEAKSAAVRIENTGSLPLHLEKVRSKSRWMTVVEAPETIAPGDSALAVLEVRADRIDRFFRCEYTVTTDDPTRRVVHGAVLGEVRGRMPWVADPARLLEDGAAPAPSRTDVPVAAATQPTRSSSSSSTAKAVAIAIRFGPWFCRK